MFIYLNNLYLGPWVSFVGRKRPREPRVAIGDLTLCVHLSFLVLVAGSSITCLTRYLSSHTHVVWIVCPELLLPISFTFLKIFQLYLHSR